MSIASLTDDLQTKIKDLLSLNLDDVQEQDLFYLIHDKLEQVYDQGIQDGEEEGYSNGYTEGHSEGHTEGFDKGMQQTCEDCFENGWEEGRADLLASMPNKTPEDWL
jgi:flagellar biosynthesis/type III secretory pathway protein FliH